MIARIQQVITLSLLALAAAWAFAFASRGAYSWAAVGGFIIVFGYAVFLALEFALLVRFGSVSDEAPTTAELVRAWAAEVVHAPRVFCWRQPFRSAAVPDMVPEVPNGRRGVVLVHGFVCNRGLWLPWLKRLRALDIPFVAVNLEPPFGSIDAYVGIIDEAVQRLHATTGQAPVVVAHSMGGLAARAWRVRYPGPDQFHRMVTVASPHHGTWLGRFALTPNGREMHTGSAWLMSLAQTEHALDYAHFTCFYGPCDNIVFPSRTATLPGADNRHLPATAHVQMAFHPQVIEEVLRWVRCPASKTAYGSSGIGPPLPASEPRRR